MTMITALQLSQPSSDIQTYTHKCSVYWNPIHWNSSTSTSIASLINSA